MFKLESSIDFSGYFFNRMVEDRTYRKSYNYLLGMYLGDGNINISKNQMRFSCSLSHPIIIEKIKREICVVFGEVNIGEYSCEKRMKTIAFTNKYMSLVFPQAGVGAKHTRDVSLVSWQKENIEYEELALGLFHSDGSYYNSKTKSIYGKIYDRYFYSFTNTSHDINEIYKTCLDNLEIEYKFYLKNRKPTNRYIGTYLVNNTCEIFHTVIQKKSEVEKAYKIFGHKS